MNNRECPSIIPKYTSIRQKFVLLNKPTHFCLNNIKNENINDNLNT